MDEIRKGQDRVSQGGVAETGLELRIPTLNFTDPTLRQLSLRRSSTISNDPERTSSKRTHNGKVLEQGWSVEQGTAGSGERNPTEHHCASERTGPHQDLQITKTERAKGTGGKAVW